MRKRIMVFVGLKLMEIAGACIALPLALGVVLLVGFAAIAIDNFITSHIWVAWTFAGLIGTPILALAVAAWIGSNWDWAGRICDKRSSD